MRTLALARDPDGGYVTGAVPGSTLIQRRNDGFGVLWSETQTSLLDVEGIALDGNGRGFAVGSRSAGGTGPWVAEFDTTDGAEVWSVRTNDVPALGRPRGIAVTPNGDVVVAGNRQGAPWVARLGPDGATHWAREANEDCRFEAVAVRSDGGVVACGTVDGGGQGDNIFVASYAP